MSSSDNQSQWSESETAVQQFQQQGGTRAVPLNGDSTGAESLGLEAVYSGFGQFSSIQRGFHHVCMAFWNDRAAVTVKYEEMRKRLYWNYFEAIRPIDDLEIISELAWSYRYLIEYCLARLVELNRDGVGLESAKKIIISKITNESLEIEWSDTEFYNSILRYHDNSVHYTGSLTSVKVLSDPRTSENGGIIPAPINIEVPSTTNSTRTGQFYSTNFWRALDTCQGIYWSCWYVRWTTNFFGFILGIWAMLPVFFKILCFILKGINQSLYKGTMEVLRLYPVVRWFIPSTSMEHPLAPGIGTVGGISHALNQKTGAAVAITKVLVFNPSAAIASVWASLIRWRLPQHSNASVTYIATVETTPLSTSIYRVAKKTMYMSSMTPYDMRLPDLLRETKNEIDKAIPALIASDLKQKNRMASDWEVLSTNFGALVDLGQKSDLEFGYLVERFAHVWEDAMNATERINTPIYLRVYPLTSICAGGLAAIRLWFHCPWSLILYSTCATANLIAWETSYCLASLDRLTSSSFYTYWLDWTPGLAYYIQETLIHRERAFKNLVIFLAGMSKEIESLHESSKEGVRITKEGTELLRHVGVVWRESAEQVAMEVDIMNRREKEQRKIDVVFSTFWLWLGYPEATEDLTEKRARLVRQQELLTEVQQPYKVASGHFEKIQEVLGTWSLDLQRIMRELDRFHGLIQRGDEGVWKSGMDWEILRNSLLDLKPLLRLFRNVEERRKAQAQNDAALVHEEKFRCLDEGKTGGRYLKCMNENLLH